MLKLDTILTTSEVIAQLYKDKKLTYAVSCDSKYLILTTENKQQSALVVRKGETLHLACTKLKKYQGIEPKDAPQRCFFDALQRFSCIVALGLAGSGKTFLSVAYAIHKMYREDKRIVLVKPSYFVGGKSNAIAPVKGDVREKLEPYITSFTAHINKLMGENGAFFLDEWEMKGQLEFTAVELVRGRHFENSIVIIDEAQNLSAHELLSLVSRVANSSQLILLGDSQQIDTGARWKETGLFQFLDSDAFWASDYTGGIRFTKTYRGVLAELASQVLYEINNHQEEDDNT